MSRMHLVKVEKIAQEVHHTKTYRFRLPFTAKPGQFAMCWYPGVDEIPNSFSYLQPLFGVTIHKVGDASTAFFAMEEGGYVGVRGPFGNFFSLKGKRILAVAGGTGMASVITAMEAYRKKGARVTTAVGARTKEELLFASRARRCGPVHVATDDGSAGRKGFVTDMALELLQKGSFDRVITCGPEIMLLKLVQAADKEGVPAEVAAERYMLCGMGICDACALDGYLVCKDGPIFDGAALLATEDFGKWRYDGSHRRVPLMQAMWRAPK